MYAVSCSKQIFRVPSGSVTVDNESKDDMRSCGVEQVRQGLLCLHDTILTVGFVDDDNLVCQVYTKTFSSIAMEKKVVRQGDDLHSFSSRHLRTPNRRCGLTSACEIASREAKYGQVWDACPVTIKSSMSLGDALGRHGGERKVEPEIEKARTSIWSRKSCRRLSSMASGFGKYGHRLSPPAAEQVPSLRDKTRRQASDVIPCRSSRQRSSRSPPCAFSLSFKQSCFREPRLTKRVSGRPS